ncbi:MAG: choice-of-anchor H family protein [Granulosicoccus sp.]
MNQFNLKIRAIQSAVAATLAVSVTTGFPSIAISAANEVENSHTEWTHHDVRITEIGLLLFNDEDRDGYFTRFSMTIDAEARYHEERVYAAIDLMDSALNTEVLHVTDDFSLYSNTASNDYQVDLDLVRNYSTDFYNLKVSLHSAIDNRVLDYVNAPTMSNLRSVPLESEDLDRLTHNDGLIEPGSDFSNADIRVNEYAGSASILLIVGAFLTLVGRLLLRGMNGATTLPSYRR